MSTEKKEFPYLEMTLYYDSMNRGHITQKFSCEWPWEDCFDKQGYFIERQEANRLAVLDERVKLAEKAARAIIDWDKKVHDGGPWYFTEEYNLALQKLKGLFDK